MIDPIGSSPERLQPRSPGLESRPAAGRPLTGLPSEGAPPETVGLRVDEVALSGMARDVAVVQAHLGDRDAERLVETQAVKNRVDAGAYRLEVGPLAQRIVDDAKKNLL